MYCYVNPCRGFDQAIPWSDAVGTVIGRSDAYECETSPARIAGSWKVHPKDYPEAVTVSEVIHRSLII